MFCIHQLVYATYSNVNKSVAFLPKPTFVVPFLIVWIKKKTMPYFGISFLTCSCGTAALQIEGLFGEVEDFSQERCICTHGCRFPKCGATSLTDLPRHHNCVYELHLYWQYGILMQVVSANTFFWLSVPYIGSSYSPSGGRDHKPVEPV